MITIRPKHLNCDTSGSVPTDVLLRQEPEDDEEDKKDDDSEDENDGEDDEGYSE